MATAKKAAPAKKAPAKKAAAPAARPAAKKAAAAPPAAPKTELAPAAPKAAEQHEPGSRYLGQGSTGDDVALVQVFVSDALNDELIEDGVYGPVTEKAVKRWQKARGRQLHGEIRKADWRDILAPPPAEEVPSGDE